MVDETSGDGGRNGVSGDGGNTYYELAHVQKCWVGTGGQWVAMCL